MSQDFNPYLEWLGVASASPSPSYYELLGLMPLEADLGKINTAYQRQSNQLAVRLSGSQARLAQRLMSELAEARMTLMTPTAKRAYDQALASRSPAVPAPATDPSHASSTSDVQAILPPAASPQAASPVPAVAPSVGHSPYHAATPQSYQGQGYGGHHPGYGVPQAYAVPQAQAAVGARPASATVPSYYAAPQAIPSAATPMHQAAEPAPIIRRRPARRQSSAVPALFGTAVVIAGVLAGIWLYSNHGEQVAVNSSGDPTSDVDDRSQPPRKQTTAPTKNGASKAASDTHGDAQGETPPPEVTPSPSRAPDSRNDPSMPAADPNESASGKAGTDKPDKASPALQPAPDTPATEKPTRQPKPSEASPEEAAAVAKILKDVRAALGARDLAKAKDLLDEATIEATASDTLTQLSHVELLTRYVENFWEAARKTLPKLQAAESIEVDGKMIAIVEADENHLVVRLEGSNREYTWQKIPLKIAYYLADRWLAPDDAVRNLVLAAFQIVEPKGDRAQAELLLNAATAAHLDAEPLRDELKAARGG